MFPLISLICNIFIRINSPPSILFFSLGAFSPALTSGVCGVPVLAQVLLVPSVGSDGRPGVRVLVDQILNTFPAAEPKEQSPKNKSLSFFGNIQTF